jgi:nucleotide-binding universal stress UspA family protein
MTEAPQIRKIVAATDLSECARTAVSFAKEIARATGGALTVVHVENPRPEYTAQVLAGAETVQRLADQRHALVHSDFDRHLAAVPEARRIIVTGPTASAILGAADRAAADLIVIGTRGHGPLKRALLGSVAEAVILDSRRPVLSIRCGDSTPAPGFRRIVCAVDYSAVSGKAFGMAAALASAFNARLQAVYVADRPKTTKREDERLRAWVRTDWVACKVVARKGTAAATLMAFAESNDADLLVIGARRKVLSKRTSLGSTATALTHKAGCPVLIVSARQATRSATARPRRGRK